MDDALLGIVLERLTGKPLPTQAESFLLAALDGDQELDAQLSVPETKPYRRDAASIAQPDPVAAYLHSVTVTGLGGTGPQTTPEAAQGPGLTLVVGQNVLGLEDLTDADKRLRAAQRICEDTLAEIANRLEVLRAKLEPLADTDERARICLTALSGTNSAKWDIKTAEAAAAGVAASAAGGSDLAAEIAAWCDDAAQALAENDAVPALKQACNWLAEANADLRDERLAPLADKSRTIWAQLRHQTMPDSPFNFLLIDDPVQAEHPAKVTGLAKVLDSVAQDRPVIVLTPDPRLAAAIKHLSIPATILEVTRRPRPPHHDCPN